MAKYDLYKVHGIDNKEKEEKFRARIVPEGTISKEKLYKWVEKTSGFNHAQADAVMTCVTDAVIEYLRDGYTVQLGDLGYLSATVSSRPVKEKKEIRAASVQFKNVNLRMSADLRKKMRFMPLERVEESTVISKDTPLEQKAAAVKEYMKTHPCITRADYCRITHVLKTKALKDLNYFVEKEGWLKRHGVGRTVVYLLS